MADKQISSKQNTRCSKLLINGFIRQFPGTFDFNFFPTELARIIFDFYYLAHEEWLNQNFIIQMVDPNQRKGERIYLGGHFGSRCVQLSCSVINNGSTIWKIYPNAKSGGFILCLLDIEGAEYVIRNKNLGIFTWYFSEYVHVTVIW